MDAGPSVNQAPFIAPTQWQSASYPPNILTGASCTRCGRATEPGNVWNICGSCAMGGPRPGAAMATGPSSPSTMKPYPTRIANCIACRVPLRVPASHYQTAHTLCSPCQVLHVAIVKPNPRDHTAPRGNHYPAVPPTSIAKTPRALALTLAFAYPNHPAPYPTSGSVGGGRVYTGGDRREDAPGVCMRFGCGARLPGHVLGDMCEACQCDGAGFVRPPPAVVQKRVPRRATERTCPRPQESLDLVRTSLLPEAVHGAKVTTEGRDVENESEVELVYPDDTPVATQYTSTTPESKKEGSKPIEDEDVELELVYPEDAAHTTWTSSKPRTKSSSPSTTLRELFKDSLRTIPTLQHSAALADKGPPRRCRMSGCNEALPAQTCMQRCIKCTVGDWKRRKLASKHTLDPSRRPGTSSLMTGTSMEEKEVRNTFDEMSDVEDGSALPPPPPSSAPSKGSSNELTGDHGVSSIPSWDTDRTELSRSDSDAESMSDSGPEPDLRLTGPHGGTGLRIRIPLLVTRLPPGNLLRKCGNKRCNIALPKDLRWKTCDPCRRAQRIKFEDRRRRMMDIERLKSAVLSCRRWRSLSPDMREADVCLTPETSRSCSVRQCQNRIPLPEVRRWKTCTSCRARARRMQDALQETQYASCRPEIVSRFPAYQNRGTLLSSFDAQLKRFVEGQVMYFRAKLHDGGGGSLAESEPWKPDHTSIIFVFMGEYSIITGQRGDRARWPDKPEELDAMRQEVSSIVLDLEGVLRAKLRAGEAFAIDKGGIIMRFTCSLELIAQLRPLATTVCPVPSSASDSEANASTAKRPPSPPAVPLVKTFSGELEAVVVPDESHRLFHGRRMVVRYRMVG